MAVQKIHGVMYFLTEEFVLVVEEIDKVYYKEYKPFFT